MNTPLRVTVTGAAGRLGRAAVAALVARGHHVVGFDRVPVPGLPPDRTVIGTLADVDAIRRAVAGAACVVHLAACPDDAAYPPGETDNFLSDLVPANVVGPYHVLEAVRRAGVPRVVLASTGQVVEGHFDTANFPITASAPPRPRYLYACTKVFLEAVGQVYAREHRLGIVAVRLGWCPRDAGQVAEIAADPEAQDVFLSPGDAGRFFVAAAETPFTGFSVVYATSRPTFNLRYDLGPARKLLGFDPQDQWPTGATEF